VFIIVDVTAGFLIKRLSFYSLFLFGSFKTFTCIFVFLSRSYLFNVYRYLIRLLIVEYFTYILRNYVYYNKNKNTIQYKYIINIKSVAVFVYRYICTNTNVGKRC